VSFTPTLLRPSCFHTRSQGLRNARLRILCLLHSLARLPLTGETGEFCADSRCSDFMIVRMPELSLKTAFSGACSCQQVGGCDVPAAVPAALSQHVDFVEGIGATAVNQKLSKRFHTSHESVRNYSPAGRRRAARKEGSDEMPGKKGPWYPDCLKTEATPPCLKKAYNCTKTTTASSSNSQGVALFGGQFFSPEDLVQFEGQYKLPPQTVRVLNDNKPSLPGNEASLDVQYITGMGPEVDTVFMHYACTSEDCRPFLSWILQQANTSNPARVQSVSVGTTEYEYVEAMGDKFTARVNQEFMKAGMRGMSLLFAAGDRAIQHYKGKYWVNFPSCSPYVTAVGGVWLGELGGGPMSVDPDTTGGFANSEVHMQHSYQKAAVDAYLVEAAKQSAKQAPVFNSSFRCT
jgi:hypothetical protein